MIDPRPQQIVIDGLTITSAPYASGNRVCYFISPLTVTLSQLNAWAQKYRVSIVLITGMDWDNQLTPWPAPNVPATLPPFKGEARFFAETLVGQVLPRVENGGTYERTLAGVSLSGLFALWEWVQSDTFVNLGSISGSFWYEGFMAWLQDRTITKSGKVYLSLGTKEGDKRGPQAFRDIQEQTRDVARWLAEQGVQCHFEPVPGNHYAQMEPRVLRMLEYLYS